MALTAAWKKKLIKFALDGVDPLTGVTTLYISLHTADPVAGAQNTSEASYTGYGRISILRNISDWNDLSNGVVNDVLKTFGSNTGASQTIMFFGIGLGTSGATELILSGTVNTPSGRIVANGDAPAFQVGDLQVTG